MIRLFLLFILISYSIISKAQPSQKNINRVLAEINKLRSKGCICGNERMAPVGPLKWHQVLYRVSNTYARYLARNRHFDHISKEGEDLGDRLDRVGYQWNLIGENLGVGYDDFYAVFRAWQESPDHCKMLMNPRMKEMGIAKKGKYWVQHFGTKMPEKTIRKKVYYREG